MSKNTMHRPLSRRGLVLGTALLAASTPSWAIFGVWRRAARRTVFVAGAATAAAATTAAVATTAAAENAAAANAAAANQAAANQAAAARSAADAPAAQQAKPTTTPEQAAAVAKLKELKSLQSQGLITEAQYQAESQKLLQQIVQ